MSDSFAVTALKKRAARRLARANRSTHRNERRKCLADATLLTQAVIEIERDKKLAERVEGGWRRALGTVIEHVREREARAALLRGKR